MFQRIIVPVDGSKRSWVAVRHGAVVAAACDAQLEIVNVVFDHRRSDHARQEIRSGWLAERQAVEPFTTALIGSPSDDTVGTVIARHAESVNGAMVVMSSTGRGRTAAMLGSVADEVVRAMFGPIIVVGPHAEVPDSLAGDIIVPVDGSEFSETSLPLAAAWGIGLGATPWIVEVMTEQVDLGADLLESSYPNRLALGLRARSHHDVQFEVLHGGNPATAISDYAASNKAMFILMGTHGRTGLRRLTLGSTAASVVHSARCPVVLHRPPRFRLTAPN